LEGIRILKTFIARLISYGELVMFSHSIFSFSFLTLAALAASGGLPELREALLLVAAFLGGRTSANAFNRIADRSYDGANERTASRHLPSGTVSVGEAAAIAALAFALLAVAAFLLRPLCAALLPVAGLLMLGYSYTKRFTWLCHLILGVACACAPAGAWIALRGTLEWPALVLCGANALWVMGFDVVYAIQDIDFDRKMGLRSIPARFGERLSLKISALCHAAAVAFLGLFGFLMHLGAAYFIGVAATAILLAWAAIAARADYRKNVLFASYSANQVVSTALLAASLAEFLI
jgi:4-hydroxybenzoate polyprenyltransferase